MGATSVHEIASDQGFSISPNPFNNQTTLFLNKERKNATIKIINVLGKEVEIINFSGKEININKAELQLGIYFVTVFSEEKTIIGTSKVIIQYKNPFEALLSKGFFSSKFFTISFAKTKDGN